MNPALIGATEVARLLAVSRATVWRIACTPGFPPPVAEHAREPLWARKDVEAWLAATGGRPVLH